MAWGYAKLLNARLAVVEKRRMSPDEVEHGFVIGEVEGRNVVIVDDLISTAGTVSQAAKTIKEKGALRVIVAATHAVFCGNAIEKLSAAPIESIIVTDTIPVTAALSNLQVLSVSDLLGEAVHRIHTNKSVSYLFRKSLRG